MSLLYAHTAFRGCDCVLAGWLTEWLLQYCTAALLTSCPAVGLQVRELKRRQQRDHERELKKRQKEAEEDKARKEKLAQQKAEHEKYEKEVGSGPGVWVACFLLSGAWCLGWPGLLPIA
jgi:hypothetical protein